MQSLGEIELRVLAVGVKICVFLYVTLGLNARDEHSSKKDCVTVYESILMRLSVLFFRMGYSFRYTNNSHFYC